jgi:(1->4)-alpha-D-glucan 1-alpha-D-glucosylmutase
LRKEHPDVFEVGEYMPLTVQGAKANHAIAFIRKFEDQSVLVVVPRLVAGLLGENEVPPIGAEVWKDTQVLLPTCYCSKAYRNVYTGEVLSLKKGDTDSALYLSSALANFPLGFYLQD